MEERRHVHVKDREFIDDIIEKTVPYIKLAILPELVGKWFTKQNLTVNEDETAQQPETKKMRIGGVTVEWVKITVP